MKSQSFLWAATASLVQLAQAQTFTECNPLNTTCPSDPALGKSITIDFTQGASSEFTLADATTLKYGANGAEFTVGSTGLAQTITSNNYIFFGKVEVVMRSAPGTGIVSSIVMQSDDLDEIDLEWLGGEDSKVETNYYGKGQTAPVDPATYYNVADPEGTWHTYTVDWSASALIWSIDGAVIRTLNYADADGGASFPQTPMRIKVGIWDGGGPGEPEGTVEWAGGVTDLTKAPFTMYVKSIAIQDGTTSGSTYTYSDKSGSYKSIVASGPPNGSGNSASSSSSAQSSPSSPPASSASSSEASSPSSSSAATSQSTSVSVGYDQQVGQTTTPPKSDATTLSTTTSTSLNGTSGNGSASSTSAGSSSSSTPSSTGSPKGNGTPRLSANLGFLVMSIGFAYLCM